MPKTFLKYVADNPRAAGKRKRGKVLHALVMNADSSMEQFKKRCHVFYPKQIETKVYCIGCSEQPGLCSVEHFRAGM